MSVHQVLLLVGALVQLGFAGFQLMFVIFSAASIIDRRDPGPLMQSVFTGCMVVVPLVALVTAGWLAYLAFNRPVASAHLWHLVPVCTGLAYLALAAWWMR